MIGQDRCLVRLQNIFPATPVTAHDRVVTVAASLVGWFDASNSGTVASLWNSVRKGELNFSTRGFRHARSSKPAEARPFVRTARPVGSVVFVALARALLVTVPVLAVLAGATALYKPF